MENSPNEVKVPQPGRRGMSKRPMYIVIGVTLALIASLFYAIDQADKRNARREAENKKPQVDERALVQGQGQGVIFPPPPTTGSLVEGASTAEQPKKPLVVVMREQEPDQEAEALRKRREQQYLAALSSPMVKQGGSGAADSSGAAAAPPGAG